MLPLHLAANHHLSQKYNNTIYYCWGWADDATENDSLLISHQQWSQLQALDHFEIESTHKLVGGWATPLKNMTSSIGMMTFPRKMGKCQIHGNQTTNQQKLLSEGCCWLLGAAVPVTQSPSHQWISDIPDQSHRSYIPSSGVSFTSVIPIYNQLHPQVCKLQNYRYLHQKSELAKS